MESKWARETQLDMGKVFESFDRGFGGAEIGISLRESHFDVLGDPFGTVFRHLRPFLEHKSRKLFVLEARQHMPLTFHLRRSDSASKHFPFTVEIQSCREVEEEE